jgi:signal transduction histidine kinase
LQSFFKNAAQKGAYIVPNGTHLFARESNRDPARHDFAAMDLLRALGELSHVTFPAPWNFVVLKLCRCMPAYFTGTWTRQWVVVLTGPLRGADALEEISLKVGVSITLQEIIDPRLGPLAGDAGRLQQVVWNLLSNAVKFTPDEGKIQVRVERVNSHAELIVADTGQGIDSAALESVFDRFWQPESRGQSKSGMGLGLSIVKEIITLHATWQHRFGPQRGSR